MRRLAAVVAASFILSALPLVAWAAETDQATVLYVPYFKSIGDQNVGNRVATVLQLQIWTSFRRAPYPNPSDENFGHGLVVWGGDDMSNLGFQEVVQEALKLESSMGPSPANFVLTGRTYRAPDGAVIQSTLIILPTGVRPVRPQPLWSIALDNRRTGQTISLEYDVPDNVIPFNSIILPNSLIAKYENASALAIYDAPVGGNIIGEVGRGMTAAEQNGNVVRIKSLDGKTGYVRLPQLLDNQNDIANFVSALIRVFRRDLKGAIPYLEKVGKSLRGPQLLKIDTLLFKGFCLDQIGADGSSSFAQAKELAPLSASVAVYIAMNILQHIAEARRAGGPIGPETTRFEKAVAEAAELLPSTDPWIENAKRVIQLLKSG